MPKVTPHQEPPAQPRGSAFTAKVLDATLTLLARDGYERLSIPQIAEHAQVNKTSIYRRWPTKVEMVRDAFGMAMGHASAVPDTGELHGDLVALTKTVAAFMQSRNGMALFKISLIEGDHPQLRALAEMAKQAAASDGPAVVIERAVARGEIKAKLNPSLVLFTLAGALLHRIYVEHRKPSDAFVKQLVALVLHGAAARH